MIHFIKCLFRSVSLTALVLGFTPNVMAQTVSPPSHQTATATAQGSGRGFTFTVPPGWLLSKTTDDFMDLVLDKKQAFEPMMCIMAQRMPHPPTLEALRDQQVQSDRKSKGFQSLSDNLVDVSGVPGFKLTSMFHMGTPARLERGASVMVVRNNIVYTFFYEALPSDFVAHSSDFDAVLKSLQWNNIHLAEKVPSIASIIGRMTNQVYNERLSPGGRYVATLAYRDGLTYGYEFLCLQERQKWHPMRPDDPIINEVGEMGDEGINGIAWAGPRTLIVKYSKSVPKDCFVKREKVWHGIRIVWRAE